MLRTLSVVIRKAHQKCLNELESPQKLCYVFAEQLDLQILVVKIVCTLEGILGQKQGIFGTCYRLDCNHNNCFVDSFFHTFHTLALYLYIGIASKIKIFIHYILSKYCVSNIQE